MKRFVTWLGHEFWEAVPIACFFFVGFVIVLMMVKLSLAQYSIQIPALSRALIGALIAAKVVLILDNTRIARSFRKYPRIVPVMFKTAIYALCVVVLRYLELTMDLRRHPDERAVLPDLVHGGLARLLAVTLGVTMVFTVYFVLAEIAEHVGSGILWDLFFGGGAGRKTPELVESRTSGRAANSD
jgi:hypothetical protein